MGSWSVYCGISRISITSGNKCVLLPLKKVHSDTYLPYLPATLPIFGEYDDYGGIENIEETENTKFIEEYFNCTIEDFCQFFTRGIIRDDEDDFPKELKNVEEIKDWKFMFIDRQVYDFLSSNVGEGYGGAGHLDYGNPKILELLGFKHEGENEDPRYKQTWSYGDKKIMSDGTWMHLDNGSAIYYFHKEKYGNGLLNYIDLPEDKLWIGEKASWQLWQYMDKSWVCEHLLWILGISRSFIQMRDSMDYFENVILNINTDLEPEKAEKIKILLEEKRSRFNQAGINYKYTENYEKFGDLICDLVTIRHNMHCFSGHFEPHMPYVTPQCGEHKDHQVILEKFAEINKSYIGTDGTEDE